MQNMKLKKSVMHASIIFKLLKGENFKKTIVRNREIT